MQFMYDNAAQNDYIEMHVLTREHDYTVEHDRQEAENALGIKVRLIRNSSFWIGRKYNNFWGEPRLAEFRREPA